MADDDKTEAKSDEALLEEGRDEFEECQVDPAGNRVAFEADTRFVRLREQWPQSVAKYRQNRPTLTIDHLGPVIRQVVNDSRQNKPGIKVHPVDNNADVQTADVLNGLIRNIEYSSNADVAYDTAVECAVGGNVGYFLINAKYAHEDAFEMDLAIERIANPLSVYPDPNSTAADSSDWNVAFIVTRLSEDDYETQYGDKHPDKIDWQDDGWKGWRDDEGVLVADWWRREQYEKTIVKAVDGNVYDEQELKTDPELQALLQAGAIRLATDKLGQPLRRVSKCWRVKRVRMSGGAVLEKEDWPGQYIPIVPVYGDEFWIDGVRYLRSLINGAKDAQQMFNVMRSTAVELYGLSPKVPYIVGPNTPAEDPNWETANSVGHPYLVASPKDNMPPQRLPLDPGPAVGAMNEALAASDDIKAITGLYDASLGQRSNETSGKAILARQHEGDTSTFHFIDNLRRAIRHAGRILVDLIPHFYSEERIIRVIGEDGKESAVQVNKQFPQVDPQTGQPMTQDGQPPLPDLSNVIMAIHNLTVGKYDVTVSSGPSFTTQREEAVQFMTEMMRAFPASAPVVGPRIAKMMDFQGAEEIGDELKQLAGGGIPPQVQKLIEDGKQQIAQLTQENQRLKADQQTKLQQAQIDASVSEQQALIKAETDKAVAEIQAASRERIAAMNNIYRPAPQQAA